MRYRILIGLTLALTMTAPVVAQRLASSLESRKRAYIRHGPDEALPRPDVLTLADGTRLEVYFLQILGERAIFFLEEGDRFWVREEVPSAQITRLERGQYLPEDPLRGPPIERAAKQPEAKEEILAGIFEGTRGLYSRWRFEFHSEIDKLGEFATNAIEHGRFTLDNEFRQATGDRTFAHEVHARGRYNLYAPDSANNKEWLLVLYDVVLRDRDLSPERSFGTRVAPYEALIVDFTDAHYGGFRLYWSTTGDGVWSGITQPIFRRRGTDAAAPMAGGGIDRRAPWQGASTMHLLRASWNAGTPPPVDGAAAETRGNVAADAPQAPRGAEKLRAQGSSSPLRWKTNRWSRPLTRWRQRA